MLIRSLEKMEKIVETNKSLHWDGWDVLELNANPTAWMKVNAAFINNTWNTVKRYSLSEQGWEIPTKFVRTNEQ